MGGKLCKCQATSAIHKADASGIKGGLNATLTGKHPYNKYFPERQLLYAQCKRSST